MRPSDKDKGQGGSAPTQRDLTLIPEPQTAVTRFLSLHMVLLYLFYIFTFSIYILQEKVENCMATVCAKCRGDGLFEDYDSEVEEEELKKMDANCAYCTELKDKQDTRRQQVRESLGLQFRDNNALDAERRKAKEGGAERGDDKYGESSDEEPNVVGGAGDGDASAREDALGLGAEDGQLGHYADDFYKEIGIDYLFYYFDLNNFELQRAIQALTQSACWNTQYNHKTATKYVGETYRQAHMKQMIGLFKRRRRTFKRRFIQIMRQLNPRISIYLTFGTIGAASGNVQDLFLEQLNVLRRIMIKKDSLYNRNEAPNQQYSALTAQSWRQKQVLNQLDARGRLRQPTQSYDVLDQPSWQGVMSIVKLYLPEIKSDMISNVVVNTKKNEEMRLTETLPDQQDAEEAGGKPGAIAAKDVDAHFELVEERAEEEDQSDEKAGRKIFDNAEIDEKMEAFQANGSMA